MSQNRTGLEGSLELVKQWVCVCKHFLVLVPFVLLTGCAATTTITSNPSGASISVNDKEVGATPITATIQDLPGPRETYAITASLSGYFSQTKTFQARALQTAFDCIPSQIHFDLRPLSQPEESPVNSLAPEERQAEIARFTDEQAKAEEILKLHPSERLSVADVNDALLTWKNRHLEKLLRTAKTEDLRSYLDQIEHTILQATGAAEREKDAAQRLIVGGAASSDQHTELARTYQLRIEVLKPILAAIKEELTNRSK